MSKSPEESSGVGEKQDGLEGQTDFNNYLAEKAILALELAASDLLTIASTHPFEFPYALKHATELRQLLATMDAELKRVGYGEKDITRVAKSRIEPTPHDPMKPRTNT